MSDRSEILYKSEKGLQVFPYDQVRAALRDRFAIDTDLMPTEVLLDYVSQWRKEVDWLDENPAARERPPQPRVDKEEVMDDLWERHIPNKNTYITRSEGRRAIHRRVFQRRDAPGWSLDNCHYCMCTDMVCKNHQFELYGRKGIDDYVKEVMETGWFRHAWYNTQQCHKTPSFLVSLRLDQRVRWPKYGKVRLLQRLNLPPSPIPMLPAGILTQYLSIYKSKDQLDALRDHSCDETAARVDIIDAWRLGLSDLWRQFRYDLDRRFTREFGIRLPLCSPVPSSDQMRQLMRQFRKQYIA